MLPFLLVLSLAAAAPAHAPGVGLPAGSEACVECHQEAVAGFATNTHARLAAGWQTDARRVRRCSRSQGQN